MGEARYPQSMFQLVVIVNVAFASAAARGQVSGDTEWPNYGNDPGGMRYSPLSQINRENVSTLKVAWIFHTGDVSDGSRDRKRSGFEATPILVDGTLYFTTPFNRVIALDPGTGKQRCSTTIINIPLPSNWAEGTTSYSDGPRFCALRKGARRDLLSTSRERECLRAR